MIRRVAGIISRDLLHLVRDNILIYAVVVPLVMAVGFRVLIPSLEAPNTVVAVDNSLSDTEVMELADYFVVERFDGYAGLRDRVLEFDDVVGFRAVSGGISLVLEGNEGDYVVALAQAVASALGRGESAIPTEFVAGGSGSPEISEYAAIILVVMCLTIGGFVMGLTIVEDRENRSIEALATTPLRTGEYLAARGILGSATALALSVVVLSIMLGPASLGSPGLFLALISSLTLSLIFGLALGVFSSNQLGAVALTKAIATPYTLIPLAGIFMPRNMHPFLYAFPNYWSFEAMRRSLLGSGSPVVIPSLVTIALGVIVSALLWGRAKSNLRI